MRIKLKESVCTWIVNPPFNKDDLKSILRKKTKGHFSMTFSFKNINR